MRRLMITALITGCLSQAAAAQPFHISEASIDDLHQAIQSGQTTCEAVVSASIQRIKKYNLSTTDKAPINAITEINPAALSDARALDKAYKKQQKLSGPLHCVTIILKDNIDSYDTTTTTGSFSMLGSQPNRDAFLVGQLRQAGAIILAKGGMDEFAWGLSGISSRTGRIGNAYDADLCPGGSSGGPAAAVSANFAMIGIGTDNSGSVRIPAAFNGLAGLRPTRGLISQHGLFPMGNLDGTAGPMTRNIKDLAIVLSVLATPDVSDKKTLEAEHPANYTSFLNKDALRNKRIAIIRHVGENDTFKNMPEYEAQVMEDTFNNLRKLGATLVDFDLPSYDNNRTDNQTGEIEDINDYLASFPAARKNFTDICNSGRTNNFGTAEECLKFRDSVQSRKSKIYKKVLNIFAKNKNYIHKVMDDNTFDALLIPISTHGSATYDAYSVNTWISPVSSNAGLPAIEFIAGYTPDKLPVGIELIGRQYDEGKLIGMAYAYEQQSVKRIPPTLPPADEELNKLSIGQTNGLYTMLGAAAYNEVISKRKSDEELPKLLTADKFKEIAQTQIKAYKKSGTVTSGSVRNN